jgi:aldose 1-epimerase
MTTSTGYESVPIHVMTPWDGPRGQRVHFGGEGPVAVEVCPADGCRIVSLRAFGRELLRQWSPGRAVYQYGAFPMVPWVGRLGGGLLYWQGRTYQMPVNNAPHALHGFGCFGSWTVLDNGGFGCDLGEWWPWPATAGFRVAVEGATVRLTQTVTAGPQSFPAQLGLHPWFRRHIDEDEADGAARVTMTPAWQAQRGANGLPTGVRIPPQPEPWDDCFGFDSGMSCRIDWDEVTMRMESSAPCATVFSVPEDAVCVEPQTSVPNVLNSDPAATVVEAGQTLTLETTLTFSRQSSAVKSGRSVPRRSAL